MGVMYVSELWQKSQVIEKTILKTASDLSRKVGMVRRLREVDEKEYVHMA